MTKVMPCDLRWQFLKHNYLLHSCALPLGHDGNHKCACGDQFQMCGYRWRMSWHECTLRKDHANEHKCNCGEETPQLLIESEGSE